jgi:hypothetical protein
VDLGPALVRPIIFLKWERIEPLGEWFAARQAEVVKREGAALAVGVAVPVPLRRERQQRP